MTERINAPLAASGTTVSGDPLVGLHYTLYAYVCGSASVRPSPFDGPQTFETIFNDRPNGCRFGVAQIVPVVRDGDKYVVGGAAGPFIVWDFFDDLLVRGHRAGPAGVMPPPPKWMGDSEDAMVMKAVALYTHGE